jgi:hypothetical protein
MNGNFLTLQIPLPDGRILRVPLGAMYRSLFRAMMPGKVKIDGTEVVIPFAGLPNYLSNRVNPALKTQAELYKNEDFYGQPIRKGNFFEQLLRTVWFEVESAMPLTVGTVSEGVRTGQTGEYIGQQATGQFLGVNLSEVSPWTKYFDQMEKYAQKDYDKTTDTLNATEYKDLMRNHPDLAELAKTATTTGRPKEPTTKELLSELKDSAEAQRNKGLEKQAQALRAGTISKYDYDKERSRLKAYYSGQSSAIWAAQAIADTSMVKKMEALQQPEDKALGEYLDYQAEIINDSTIPIDWNLLNNQLLVFLNKYDFKTQKYIQDHEIDWIKDLPPESKMIETLRQNGLQDDSWFADYYKVWVKPVSTTTSPAKTVPTTTQPTKKPDATADWQPYKK